MELTRPRSLVTGLALFSLCSAVVAQPGHHPRPFQGRPGQIHQGQPNAVPLPGVVQIMLANAGKWTYSGTRRVEFKLDGSRVYNDEILIVDKGRSRTEYAQGSAWEGQVLVENAQTRLHYIPSRNEIEELPRQKDENIQRLRGLLMNRRKYQIQTAVGPSIAQRPTTIISVNDLQGNLVQRVWLDNDTGLPLKRDLFDRSGSRLGSFEFTSINYRPNIDPSDFQINRKGAKRTSPESTLKTVAAQGGFLAVRISKSSGAVLKNVRLVPLGKTKAMSQAYSYQGSRVTLFQLRETPNGTELEKRAQKFGHSYQWQQSGRTFVLLGDLSVETLQALANQVR